MTTTNRPRRYEADAPARTRVTTKDGTQRFY
jgi:hypothetical protein